MKAFKINKKTIFPKNKISSSFPKIGKIRTKEEIERRYFHSTIKLKEDSSKDGEKGLFQKIYKEIFTDIKITEEEIYDSLSSLGEFIKNGLNCKK